MYNNLRKYFPVKSKGFGVRLQTLMDYNGLDRMDLAVRLCGYSQKPVRKTQEIEYENCRAKCRAIAGHLALEDIQNKNSLSAAYIADYCNILNCEPDYLFGYIDFPTHQETDIYKETGLSKTSIQTLISCKTGGILADDDFPTIDLLNFILSDKVLFHDFLNYLGLYINNTYDTPCYRDPDKHIYVPLPDDNIRNTPFVKSKNEHYIAIGKKQKEKVCDEDVYQTINLPVSLLESHAVRIIQSVIDKWKEKWKKEKR